MVFLSAQFEQHPEAPMSHPTDTTPALVDAINEDAARYWTRALAGETLDPLSRRALGVIMNGAEGFATIVLSVLDETTDIARIVNETSVERLRFVIGCSLSGQPCTAKPMQVQAAYNVLMRLNEQSKADDVPDRGRTGFLLAAGTLAWWAGMSPDLVLTPIDEATAINPHDPLARQLQIAALAAQRVLATIADRSA
jgi:hypothetical protein